MPPNVYTSATHINVIGQQVSCGRIVVNRYGIVIHLRLIVPYHSLLPYLIHSISYHIIIGNFCYICKFLHTR